MKKTFILDENSSKLTDEEIQQIRDTDSRIAEPDDDCPELTPEQMQRFSKMLAEKKTRKRTQVVSIRLSEDVIEKAKLLGSGYTGVLGRIVEYGLTHEDVLSKCI